MKKFFVYARFLEEMPKRFEPFYSEKNGLIEAEDAESARLEFLKNIVEELAPIFAILEWKITEQKGEN